MNYLIIIIILILLLFLFCYYKKKYENFNQDNETIKNVAICIYGQPRNYKDGFKKINEILDINKNINFDFFYHCWIIDDNEQFNVSPWRDISNKEKTMIDKDIIINDLLELYKPIYYEYEYSIDFDINNTINNKTDIYKTNCKNIDIDINQFDIKSSLAYNNTKNTKHYGQDIYLKHNENNILSQLYSRNKVRNLLFSYDNKDKYDMVIMTRFDNVNDLPPFDFRNKHINKVYVSNMRKSRNILPDVFIVSPLSYFLTWFDIYNNLKYVINNEEIDKKMNEQGEELIINAEELILSSYLLNYDFNNIVFY
jgi:hypothetical protein